MIHPFRLLLLSSAVLLSTSARAEEAIVPFGNVVPGYKLDWADEFNGTALDTETWMYRTDGKGWSQQQAANVSVANGHLDIAVKEETVGKFKYTGGGVISRKDFLYGYYEARYKVPPGCGWHTSFWTMAYNAKDTLHNGTQEIDICEQDSVTLEKYSAGVIAWDQMDHGWGKGFGRKYVKTPNLAAGYHVWGCEYTPTVVKFFFDGKLTHQTEATKFRHGPQKIWLTSISIGFGGTTYVDKSKLPSAAEFDYVRFFTAPGVGK